MTARCTVVGRVVRRRLVCRSAAVGIVAMLAGVGCGGPVKRAVSGTVTLDGKPLDEAVIMFVPLDIQAGKTGAAITRGRYDVPREGGLLPGRYRVEIADDPPIDHAHENPTSKPLASRRRLPVHYSVASPLVIDVAPSGPSDFDFPLTSKHSGTP